MMKYFKCRKYLNNIKFYMISKMNISYIDSKIAKQIDDNLMGDVTGYRLEQLMELAGLSVALAIHDAILSDDNFKSTKKILNISGPGSILLL